ncbi:MAG: hypothetical protein COY58_00580 [Gammaproteobacteria bacterium CG_4_10_14_0_8_um_filter_38_16]|nr:MAG: hypothetical protein COY58_00580 [Gammaproteobacteria bacterium CG_4_10_14_0_8_um_filter_38_16]PJA04254.1 MAG: hypothetical protein COX72_01380 [Gammaproteobacteria bacterium CG_4_10_14_0_2_um_filter_38_22]PJB10918.1 MAG: hypothetical protein CO120_02245 [Gammaproteobacteria bacterium CG_4_9_14_3_um_filter_38_9]
MSNFNIGIIGPGRVAHRFAKASSHLPNIKLHSIFSKDALSAKKFAEQYQKDTPITSSTDINAFLSDKNLDAVIVSTPDIHHTEYAIMAAKNGKHLLIEKPICTNIDEARALTDLLDSSKITCAVGYHLRWHAGLRELANYLHNKFSGEIYHIDIRWGYEFIHEAKWRKSFTTSQWWSLTTLGTHLVDIVRWYLLPVCGEVNESKVITTNNRYHTTDETSLIAMRFQTGATASIYSSILSHSPLDLTIHTSEGVITGSNLAGPLNTRIIMTGDQKLSFECKEDLYEKELIDLYTSANQGKQPEVTAKEGLKNIECLIGF